MVDFTDSLRRTAMFAAEVLIAKQTNFVVLVNSSGNVSSAFALAHANTHEAVGFFDRVRHYHQ
jgi:hypothetical protein